MNKNTVLQFLLEVFKEYDVLDEEDKNLLKLIKGNDKKLEDNLLEDEKQKVLELIEVLKGNTIKDKNLVLEILRGLLKELLKDFMAPEKFNFYIKKLMDQKDELTLEEFTQFIKALINPEQEHELSREEADKVSKEFFKPYLDQKTIELSPEEQNILLTKLTITKEATSQDKKAFEQLLKEFNNKDN